MTYTYRCSACGCDWELFNVSYIDREAACTKPCSSCGSEGTVQRTFTNAPTVSYQGALSPLQRAGSGWNDVLTKIKKGAGRNSKIETR